MNDKYLINTSSFLAYLIPIALLSGPFLPDFFACIISIFFLFLSYKNNEKKYFNNIFFYFFSTFYLYIVFVSFFSELPYFSLKSSLVYFRFGIFSLAIWYLIDKNKNFINNFYSIFLITFIVGILNGYYEFFFENGIFGYQALNADRLSLLFNDRMLLGNYLSRLFPLLMALFILKLSKDENYSFLSILFLSFVMIVTDVLVYISGERTALGLMTITTFMIIILLSKFKKIRIISIIISFVIIIGISLTFPDVKNRNITHTLNQIGFSQSDENSSLRYLSIQHESHIRSALNMFKKEPIIGVGPNMFRKHCSNIEFQPSKYSCSTHPHSIYIQLLSETGVFGFFFISILVLFISYQIITHFIRKIQKNDNKLSDYQICLLICFSLSLFPFLPSLNFFNNWVNIIYFLPVGFYLQSIYSKTKN